MNVNRNESSMLESKPHTKNEMISAEKFTLKVDELFKRNTYQVHHLLGRVFCGLANLSMSKLFISSTDNTVTHVLAATRMRLTLKPLLRNVPFRFASFVRRVLFFPGINSPNEMRRDFAKKRNTCF